MRKRPLFLFLLIVLCVGGILTAAFFRLSQYEETGHVGQEELFSQADNAVDQLEHSLEEAAAVRQAAQEERIRESERESEELAEAMIFTADHHKVIFVGDSRTVGMGRAVGSEEGSKDSCIYIGRDGEGLEWFRRAGLTQMQRAIEENPYSPVVFNLGVNDADEIWNYISFYQELEASYPETSFYYMSVGPVTEESFTVPDSDVAAFNEQLREAFPEQYIDIYSRMKADGFETVDGVHYTESQYRKIHDFAVDAIIADR